MTIANAQDAIVIINIGDVDYECREHNYEASIFRIADPFSVTIPAPDGLLRGPNGKSVPMLEVAKMGTPVKLSVKDPNVNGGVPVQKLTGIVTQRACQTTREGGCILAVAGADIGWHLSSCGTVWEPLQGIDWSKFFSSLCGIDLDANWNMKTDRYGWGFQGVRHGNDLSREMKLGRQKADYQRAVKIQAASKAAFEAAKTALMEQAVASRSRELASLVVSQTWHPTIPMPVLWTEVGETIDEMMIRFARFSYFLINVSADGYIQIFRPNYKADNVKYKFFRYRSRNPLRSRNNIINPMLNEQAEPLYTRSECWTTVVNPITHPDQVPKNFGFIYADRYHGSFPLGPKSGDDTTYFPVHRLHTYTDTNQMSQDKADARAEWKFKKGAFDSWMYTFETVGHSQDGIPFVEDTLCEIHDEVYGIDDVYYIAEIKASRKLASAGVDRSGNVGTKTAFTVKKKDLFLTG